MVLGIAGLVLYQRNQTSWQGGGRQGAAPKLLGDLPVNDVAAIVIKGGTNELDLVRKDDLWRVKQRNDYPANFSEISSFLLKAADLKAVQTEEIGPSQLGRYKLLPPGPGDQHRRAGGAPRPERQGHQVHAAGQDPHAQDRKAGPSPMGEMGDNEGWPDGRYVMVGTAIQDRGRGFRPPEQRRSQARPVAEQGLLQGGEDSLDCRRISRWRPTRGRSRAIPKPASDWKLADAKPDEKLDSSKTSGFSYALSSPSFNDVLPADTKPEQTGLDKPTVVTLDTFDNFTYTIKLGQKTNDNLPAWSWP